ncbi:uncharacterized protein [Equus caballus]|uniref:uncharacterized protein n=1 Tax=Equus caballus TaxID=9796 RepID=UPI0038B3942C
MVCTTPGSLDILYFGNMIECLVMTLLVFGDDGHICTRYFGENSDPLHGWPGVGVCRVWASRMCLNISSPGRGSWCVGHHGQPWGQPHGLGSLWPPGHAGHCVLCWLCWAPWFLSPGMWRDIHNILPKDYEANSAAFGTLYAFLESVDHVSPSLADNEMYMSVSGLSSLLLCVLSLRVPISHCFNDCRFCYSGQDSSPSSFLPQVFLD